MNAKSAKLKELASSNTFAILAVSAVYLFMAFRILQPEFGFSDDLSYVNHAVSVLNGTYSLASENVVDHRFSILIPVSFFVAVFGVSDFAAVVWPCLCGVAIIAMLVVIGNSEQRPIGMLAAVMFASSLVVLEQSQTLFPDLVLVMFMLTVLFSLYYREKLQTRYILLAVVLNFGLWGAFLTKLTFVYILPIIALVMFMDVLKKRNMRFWISCFTVGALLLVCYLATYHVFTGNALHRINLYGLAADRPFTDNRNTTAEIIRRITIDPVNLLVTHNGYWLGFYFYCISAALIVKNWRKGISKFEKFWFTVTSVLLLFYVFMTTSLGHYYPLPLFPRYWLVFVPLFGLLAGVNIVKFFSSTEERYLPWILTTWLFLLTKLWLSFETFDVYLAALITIYTVISHVTIIQRTNLGFAKRFLAGAVIISTGVVAAIVLKKDFLLEILQHSRYYSKTTALLAYSAWVGFLGAAILVKGRVAAKWGAVAILIAVINLHEIAFLGSRNHYQDWKTCVLNALNENGSTCVVTDHRLAKDAPKIQAFKRRKPELTFVSFSEFDPGASNQPTTALVRYRFFRKIRAMQTSGNRRYDGEFAEVLRSDEFVRSIQSDWHELSVGKSYWGDRVWAFYRRPAEESRNVADAGRSGQ